LEQSELDQERMYEELRQKKVAQDQAIERIKTQLMVGILHVYGTYQLDG